MKQGAGTFVREVATDRRSAERTKQAGRLVRQLLQEAGQLGVTTHELTEAIRRELGAKVVA
jgi:DNA-binding transcriptional regulator YhcF (GntR family)